MTRKEFPKIVAPSINLSNPNEDVELPIKEFKLLIGDDTLDANGSLMFTWMPYPSIRVKAKVKAEDMVGKLFNSSYQFELLIADNKFGQGLISDLGVDLSKGKESYILVGEITSSALFQDISKSVQTVYFSVPNLKEYFGDVVSIESLNSGHRNRVSLENKEYSIIIDKIPKYKENLKKLKMHGGYQILYGGKIQSKNGIITHENLHKLLLPFNTFLSFINGRRTAGLFLKGYESEEERWVDYTPYEVDYYKHVFSWSPKHPDKSLNTLWQRFYKYWDHENDKGFLRTVIHWYNEANMNSGRVEGAIIMAQTALELIYNRWIVEKLNICGKVNALDKIRLILHQIGISYEVPISLESLAEYVSNENDIKDGPDAIVRIRNAIVHSRLVKRKALANITPRIRFEALELSLWYIELALLAYLQYEGEYNNRCSEINNKIQVAEELPWNNKMS